MSLFYIIVGLVGRLGFIGRFGVLGIGQSNGDESGQGESDGDLQKEEKNCYLFK